MELPRVSKVMTNRLLIRIVTGVAAIVYTIGLWSSGITPQPSWLRFYSLAVLLAVVLWWAWEYWMWRLPAFQWLKSVPPQVFGTWKGILVSAWVDPTSGSSPPPKPAYLVVRQTFSTVSAVLLTDEARSQSRLARVGEVAGGVALDYMYVGEPGVLVEHRSPMHRGSASLLISGASPASRLHGRYWTDRNSKGSLDFTERSPQLADDYETAESIFPVAS